MAPIDQYWIKRIHSKAFKQSLAATVERELRALAHERVADMLDGRLIRTLIQEWDTRMLDREFLAALLMQGNQRIGRRLSRRSESLLQLIGAPLAAEVDAVLEELVQLPPNGEALITNIMQQEFVRRLLTNVIYTAIVNFYQKVNPLFGALTVRVLEEQIKSFIRLFMPMLQKQAAAFAVNKANQRLVLNFARTITRQLLDEPVRHFVATTTPARRRQTAALVEKASRDAHLASLIRDATVALWDDLYDTIRKKKVGQLLRLDENAGWLAERCAELLIPALTRPSILEFFATETAFATRQQSQTVRQKTPRPATARARR